MTIEITLLPGPLGVPAPVRPDGAGAVVVFEGVVRPLEASDQIAGLEYEAYEPMARSELQRLANAAMSEHGLLGIRIEHSVGQVMVGEVSFRLTVRSAHRKEALAALDEFIDAMKRDVPIWKRPIST